MYSLISNEILNVFQMPNKSDSMQEVVYNEIDDCLYGVSFLSNNLMKLNVVKNEWSVVFENIPGIPSSATGSIVERNTRVSYLVLLIDFQDTYWFEVDLKTGKQIRKVKSSHIWRNVIVV